MTGYFDQHHLPRLSKPIMIVGLRSNTDLGYRCAKKIVRLLKARRFAEYYSDWFPDMALVDRKGLCNLPRWVFYESSTVDPNVMILNGVTDIASEQTEGYYSTVNEIIEFSKRLAINMIVILDGMITEENGEDSVKVAATTLQLIKRAKLHKAQILRKTALPPIPSILMGLSQFHSLPAMLVVGSARHPRSDDTEIDTVLSFLRKTIGLKA